MFLLNLMFMTYLLESQGLDLSRLFIVKTQGSGCCDPMDNDIDLYFNNFNISHTQLVIYSFLSDALDAVIFMRGLILWHAWGEMGSYFMHQIYLEMLFLQLYPLIWDLLDFSPPIM